jgi:hypothetical protein
MPFCMDQGNRTLFECKALVLWTLSWNADMGAASPRDAPSELQNKDIVGLQVRAHQAPSGLSVG